MRIANRFLDKLWLLKSRSKYGGIAPFAVDPDSVPPSERARSDLHEIFYSNEGPLVHKWLNYLDVYNKFLGQFRGRDVKILEIGVSQGGSLQMWRKYFGKDAVIFGIDKEPKCAQFDTDDIHVRIGSQDDHDFLQAVVQEMQGIDIVIDDGSHVAEHQRSSFDFLFYRLNDGGIYICEDTQTAYWPTFGGGYKRKTSFIEFAKDVVDDMHYDFHGHPKTIETADRMIAGVNFYNSMVVFEKNHVERPAHVRIGKDLHLGT